MDDPAQAFEAAVDALNRADLDALRRAVDPEFVFHPIRAPVTGDYLGHAGLEAFLSDNAETFDEFHAAYDEVRPLGDGRFFAHGRVRIRGRGSQVDTTVVTAGIGSVHDGLLASWHDYGDRAAALAAAGLAAE